MLAKNSLNYLVARPRRTYITRRISHTNTITIYIFASSAAQRVMHIVHLRREFRCAIQMAHSNLFEMKNIYVFSHPLLTNFSVSFASFSVLSQFVFVRSHLILSGSIEGFMECYLSSEERFSSSILASAED